MTPSRSTGSARVGLRRRRRRSSVAFEEDQAETSRRVTVEGTESGNDENLKCGGKVAFRILGYPLLITLHWNHPHSSCNGLYNQMLSL